MRRIWRGLAGSVAVAAVLAVAAPASLALAAAGGISGTVTLPSGAPAANICIEASPWFGTNNPAFAQTGADGTYHVDAEDGTYRVRFADCGSRDLVTSWWPDKLEVNEGTTITVSGATVMGVDEQMRQGGQIAGRVLDRQGLPVSGADLWWQLPTAPGVSGLGDVRTDAQGRYLLHGIAPGSWRLKAQLSPDYPATFSGDTDDPKSAALETVSASQTTDAADIHLGRAASIVGRVVDELGQPRAGVCVTAWGSSESVDLVGTQTASDGSYTLSGVYPGTDRVSVSACQGPNVWYQNGDSYAHATPVDAAEGTTVTGIDMTLPNGPVISGRVTDANGNPVAGVWISLFDGISHGSTGGGATTDSDGRYVLTGLVEKLYLVEADPYRSVHPELVQQFWPASPSRSGALPVAAGVATNSVDFTLPLGATVSGTVTSAADGAPLDRICVTADNADPDLTRFGSTLADGSYQVRGLAAGDYDVKLTDCVNGVFAPRFWQGTDEIGSGTKVSLSLGQSVDGVNASLSPGGSLHGKVVDQAGNPLGHMCVYVSTSDPSISSGGAVTDSTGSWKASGLAPGRPFVVSVHACDPSDPWVSRTLDGTYTVTAGGDQAVPDIVLHRGGSFSGTVTDQYGHPVAGACVVSVPSDNGGTAKYFRTSVNGTYLGGGLEAGTYSANFVDCGVGMVSTYWKSPAYETRATFTVASDQTTTGIDQTVVVYTLPTAPTGVTVTPGDGNATLAWSPPSSSGHTQVTGYQVTGPAGSVVVGADARSYHFTGLTNGASYSVSVAAINAKGTGAAAAVTAKLLPVTSVSITGPSSLVSGTTADLHGRVVLSDGSGADSRAVTLYRRPAGSSTAWSAFATVHTDATGRWLLAVRPLRPTAYRVAAGGVFARWVQHVAAGVSDAVSGRHLLVATTPPRSLALVLVQHRSADGAWTTWSRTRLGDRGRLDVRVPVGRWRSCLPAAGYWAASCGIAVRVA